LPTVFRGGVPISTTSQVNSVSTEQSERERRVVAHVPTGLLVTGEWVDAEGGETFEVVDPATGLVLASVADASPADGRRALEAAVAAQRSFAETSPCERADILTRAFELMHERLDDLALLMTLEMGKPLAEARGEVAYAAEFLRHFAGEALRTDGGYQTAPAGGATLLVIKQPAGPCLLITPWNFPMAMGTQDRSRDRSRLHERHQTCVPDAAAHAGPRSHAAEGRSPGWGVNVITCMKANDVMEPLIRSGLARKLSFTGSTRVGKILLEQCAERVLRTSMELGGNAPFIVFEDADLDEAVSGALAAKMRNMGEVCTAANRIYVHESVLEGFGRRLADRMGSLTVGRGTEDGVAVGPLIDEAAQRKVTELVDEPLRSEPRSSRGAGPFRAPATSSHRPC
jgi:succinate-semialdehyde dehydrogenase/glutarate-semialdehyde dehydrogenase